MNKIHWGVLGLSGHFLRKMRLPLKHAKNATLYGIASRDEEKAKAVTTRYNIPKFYSSYQHLLEDPDIHAVYIPLPNHMHQEWIIKAAKAQKHILCEKPFCLNQEELEEAIACCEENKVLLMEAFMYRMHPQWLKIKEIIETKEIGEVTALQACFFYNNTKTHDIRNVLSYGGGALYDIGCYGISVARHVFSACPRRVCSLISRDKQLKTDTLSSAMLEFEKGHGLFSVGTQNYGKELVNIFGTEGSIYIPQPFVPHADLDALIYVRSSGKEYTISFGAVDHYTLEIEAFSDAIINKKSPPVSLNDSRENQRVIDALFLSEKKKTWIDV